MLKGIMDELKEVYCQDGIWFWEDASLITLRDRLNHGSVSKILYLIERRISMKENNLWIETDRKRKVNDCEKIEKVESWERFKDIVLNREENEIWI